MLLRATVAVVLRRIGQRHCVRGRAQSPLWMARMRMPVYTDAHRASQRLNEYRLDKHHTLNAISLSTAVRREQIRLRFIGVLRCVIALLALHRRSAERTYTPPHGIGYQHSMREFYDLVNAQLQ